MPKTFGETWRLVRLSVPSAPALLVQSWVQDTYAELTDRRPWTWTVEAGQLTWQAPIDLTDVTVTIGSVTVSGTGLFPASVLGRQFRVGTYPIYTIVATALDENSATLSLAYEGTSEGVVDAQILDAYVTVPEDFSAFLVVMDQVNQRLIPWWATREEFAFLDPTRAAAGTPLLLGAAGPSVAPATSGRLQYELYPKPTDAGSFQYYARLQPASLTEDTPLRGVLANRPDVLRTGALAKAALWPGLANAPNPYFNIALATKLQAAYEALALQLDLRDDDQVLQSWDTIPWQKFTGWGWAYNTHFLQQTDATLGSYFPGFGLGSGYLSWY